MSRLQSIGFLLPNGTKEEKEWNHFFTDLFNDVSEPHDGGIQLVTSHSDLLPTTIFQAKEVSSPVIVFDGASDIQCSLSNLLLVDQRNFEAQELEQTSSGVYTKDSQQDQEEQGSLPVEKLHELLKGRIVGVDHTGVNVPISLISPSEWDRLKATIAQACNLYQYPEEDWPFIIPADESEFATDITNFHVKRTPKFELVYDQYTNKPVLQFALETNLSKEEMEVLFPPPSGFAIPGLEEIFRCVVIQSPWSGWLTIRMDLYYQSHDSELNDWETGEWLVRNGGRIH